MANPQETKTSRLEGRQEPRVPARIEVQIRKADDSTIGEILSTENISPHGARLQAGGSWKPGEDVLLKALKLRFMAQGRIVYCHRLLHDSLLNILLGNSKFAVGVEVVSPEGNWIV